MLSFGLRYADHWHHVMQHLVFQCSLIVYMEEETLITRDQVAQSLGGNTSVLSFILVVYPFPIDVYLTTIN